MSGQPMLKLATIYGFHELFLKDIIYNEVDLEYKAEKMTLR